MEIFIRISHIVNMMNKIIKKIHETLSFDFTNCQNIISKHKHKIAMT